MYNYSNKSINWVEGKKVASQLQGAIESENSAIKK